MGVSQDNGRTARPFEAQVVLVSGGSKGLGLLLAREYGLQGAHVIILSRNASDLDQAKARLAQWGVESTSSYVCDVRNRQAVKDLAETIETEHKGIDVLVNNAGVIEVGPVATMSEESFDDAMNTMFWGTAIPTLSFLESMRRRRSGTIVNITSVGGKVAVPHLLPYTSAKFAAVGFSEGLSAELAGTGIHVLTVVPGLMRTGSFLNALFAGKKSAEFTWFALGSSAALLSLDAEVAAKRIVKATAGRERELILSPLANLGARVNGLMPGITTRVMSAVTRVMPAATAPSTEAERGDYVMQEMNSKALDRALTWGMNAAEKVQPSESVHRARAHDAGAVALSQRETRLDGEA